MARHCFEKTVLRNCDMWAVNPLHDCMLAIRCSRFLFDNYNKSRFLFILIYTWTEYSCRFFGVIYNSFWKKYFQTIFNFDTSNGLIGRTELRLTGSNSTNDCQPWHQYFIFNNRLWWHFLQITCITIKLH